MTRKPDGVAPTERMVSVDVLRGIAITGMVAGSLSNLVYPFMPIIMKIWTPSYILITVGIVILYTLICYWLVDIKGWRKWGFPFIVFGMKEEIV